MTIDNKLRQQQIIKICHFLQVNFGDVKIPRNFDYPRPQKIDALRGVHGISSDNVVIVDAQTLLVPNLSYDGEAPGVSFYSFLTFIALDHETRILAFYYRQNYLRQKLM